MDLAENCSFAYESEAGRPFGIIVSSYWSGQDRYFRTALVFSDSTTRAYVFCSRFQKLSNARSVILKVESMLFSRRIQLNLQQFLYINFPSLPFPSYLCKNEVRFNFWSVRLFFITQFAVVILSQSLEIKKQIRCILEEREKERESFNSFYWISNNIALTGMPQK